MALSTPILVAMLQGVMALVTPNLTPTLTTSSSTIRAPKQEGEVLGRRAHLLWHQNQVRVYMY